MFSSGTFFLSSAHSATIYRLFLFISFCGVLNAKKSKPTNESSSLCYAFVQHVFIEDRKQNLNTTKQKLYLLSSFSSSPPSSIYVHTGLSSKRPRIYLFFFSFVC